MSPSKPFIAINARQNAEPERAAVRNAYLRAIRNHNGIPVPVSPGAGASEVTALSKRVDGFVFTGGNDPDPSLYGAPPTDAYNPVPKKRLHTDRKLMKQALAGSRPILAICYGMQLLNILRGGDLVQDIPSDHPEAESHSADDTVFHDVVLEKGSKLRKITDRRTISVNSSHHQAVQTPGEGLSVTGRTRTGIIEAIEEKETDRFCVGVQWHPERILNRPHAEKLFSCFMDRCGEGKKSVDHSW